VIADLGGSFWLVPGHPSLFQGNAAASMTIPDITSDPKPTTPDLELFPTIDIIC
jgi:hypothetical protein